jgi:trimethylamine---corrinoid protein Co-methyltransferase
MLTPILSQKEASTLHSASLNVLANTGVKVDHEEAAALLLDSGASRDAEGRILIPDRMVDEALEKVRVSSNRIQLFTREGEPSIMLEVGKTHFGPGSDALEIRDIESGELRPAVLADVATNVTVADAVGFDFVMTMALPRDEHVYPTVYAEMIRHTSRPAVVTAASFEDMVQTYGVAEIVAGGKEALRAKPRLVAYIEPISPLHLDQDGMSKLLFMAEHGYPALFAAGANCGATAPITIEGGVSQANAEFLAGMVIALLKNEHARLVSGANTSSMDMLTTVTGYGAPEWARTVAMYAGLGEYYGLPSWGTAGCSDAEEPDFQAGVEAYESILLALQSRSTLVHDIRYLKYGFLYDPRMLVLTKMMVERARKLLRPLDLSEEALAGKAIDDVSRVRGRLDNYPSHDHTFDHFRTALWMPPSYWERGQEHSRRLPDRLTDVVKDILANHKTAPLPDSKLAEIDQFLQAL